MLFRLPGQLGARASPAKLKSWARCQTCWWPREETGSSLGLALLPFWSLQNLQKSHATFSPQDSGFAHLCFRAEIWKSPEDVKPSFISAGKYLTNKIQALRYRRGTKVLRERKWFVQVVQGSGGKIRTCTFASRTCRSVWCLSFLTWRWLPPMGGRICCLFLWGELFPGGKCPITSLENVVSHFWKSPDPAKLKTLK